MWATIQKTATLLGSLHPDHLVVGLDPNFFVTEADVYCIDGKLTGRTLYCSLPLCRILSEKELTSIIGHELGHFKGLDTHSQRFFPIYRGTATSIHALAQTGGGSVRAVALLPAIAILSYCLDCFSVAESAISRDRELEADKQGAIASSPHDIASALVKLHSFTGVWYALET